MGGPRAGKVDGPILPFKPGEPVVVTLEYGAKKLSNGTTPWRVGYHPGIDLVCADRTLVAVARGDVLRSRYDADGWGQYVTILLDDGISATYAHLKERHVVVGDSLVQGDVVGLAGSTGNSSGVHCHFEVRTNGIDPYSNIDAAKYLRIPNLKGPIVR